MNRRKLRGAAHKEILDEIMKEEAKDMEIKKAERNGKKGRKRRRADLEEARYVLQNDEEVFNGQKPRTLRSVTSPQNNNNFKRSKSPRKSKDKALLAMATACVTNNYNWENNDFLEPKQPAHVAQIRHITETVSVVKDGHITRITICNESKKNALTTSVSIEGIPLYNHYNSNIFTSLVGLKNSKCDTMVIA